MPRRQIENTVRSTSGTILVEPLKKKRPADQLQARTIGGPNFAIQTRRGS
jgi:hypothetical protein